MRCGEAAAAVAVVLAVVPGHARGQAIEADLPAPSAVIRAPAPPPIATAIDACPAPRLPPFFALGVRRRSKSQN